MKNKILACILALLCVIPFTLNFVYASEIENDTVVKAESFIDGILSFQIKKQGVSDTQNLIDKFAGNPENLWEWYILALVQNEKYKNLDYSNFEKSYSKYLSGIKEFSATSRIKYALTLISIGSTDKYISKTLEDSIGEQGIMSYIFGLHMLNNGYKSTKFTVSSLVETILSMQKKDGGWAIMGEYGDPDVTAMTLQAIGIYEDEKVKTAAAKAVEFLVKHQDVKGGYVSHGINNPESTAQVILALSTLKIDFAKDERFIKQGKNLLDVLEGFRNPDGSFSHEKGKEMSNGATEQVLYCLTAYKRFKEDKDAFYIFEKSNPQGVEKLPSAPNDVTQNPENPENPTVPDDVKTSENKGLKLFLIVFASCFGAGIILTSAYVLFEFSVRKKKNLNFKKVIAFALICVILLTGILFFIFNSKENKTAVGEVTIEIRCDVLVNEDRKVIPKDGTILKETKVNIYEGETVYNVLRRVSKENNIPVTSKGGEQNAYIQGINQIFEMEYGDLSGWMYCVNGEYISVGCGQCVLKDGDKILWQYTRNMGEDLK